MARVTIIIPTYNEEKNIEKIQDSLARLEGDFDVIFSDGFSKDNTYNLISYPKIRRIKYRSRQMNEASKIAQSEYLFFVHADSIIDTKSIKAIEKCGADIGVFKLKFDSDKLMMKIVSFFSNLRVKTRNIAFGDQGIFIKKSLFDKIGGYDDIPIMEDYKLSMDIKKLGIKFKVLKLPIITSARKFQKEGSLKTIIKMQKLQKSFRQGDDIWDIYRRY